MMPHTIAECYVKKNQDDWVIVVPECPHCDTIHMHDGGPITEHPQLGLRVSRCQSIPKRSPYYLVYKTRWTAREILEARLGTESDNPFTSTKGYVYFVAEPYGNFVKIGHSSNPLSRLKSLQTGNPRPLQLLFALEGPVELETEMHHRFERHRVSDGSEWFVINGALQEFIQANIEGDRDA